MIRTRNLNKMKTYHLILILFLVFFFITGRSSFSQSYYPLQIGDKWEYSRLTWDPGVSSETDTFYVEVIGDTLMPNQQSYFILSTDFLGVSRYIRADSNGVYYFNESDSSDWLVYNFNAHLKESYKVDPSKDDVPIVELLNVDTLTIFGEVVNTLSYSYNWMIGHNIVLSDKFGPVIHHTGGDGTSTNLDSRLIGCILDGIVYGTLTDVKVDKHIVSNFTLSQNFPNPFNPTTTIRYSIPEKSNVRINIYDIVGREVSMLLNEEKAPGQYEVNFDAGNLSSGIYFYSITAGTFNKIRKMLLLK